MANMGKDIVKLVASILITQIVGGIGGIVTAPAVKTWYPKLRKPSFNPPNWVFGPVWTILFTLMGVSLYLVWKQSDDKPSLRPQASRAKTVFGIQLGLNALWSILFFGLKSPSYALIEIGLLWAMIIITIVVMLPVSVLASVLLTPYIIWVSFALILNYYVWQLNR